MDLSVVVPTLNAEAALSDCLDALAKVAPEAERIVADGPSADGTSGMVADRDDVAVLIELADRSVNAARNAGIAAASGDVIAFVDGFTVVHEGWMDAIERAMATEADVVAGPVRSRGVSGSQPRGSERRQIAGREVTYFDGGNVAIDATLLRRLDGFDEYLAIGGSRDLAHRVAGLRGRTTWIAELSAERAIHDSPETSIGWKYRSLGYRLTKNYGVRPTVAWRIVRQAADDAWTELMAVRAGDRRPSNWLGDGRDVSVSVTHGILDGWRARRRDRSAARNPNGISSRDDRAIDVHDWR